VAREASPRAPDCRCGLEGELTVPVFGVRRHHQSASRSAGRQSRSSTTRRAALGHRQRIRNSPQRLSGDYMRVAKDLGLGRDGDRPAGQPGRQTLHLIYRDNSAKDHMRSADPYVDLDVIDSRAPRFNQSVVAILCGLALLTGWWGLASVMGLQLAVGLMLGRRWCISCVLYFEVIQPRLGEGVVEDARPPRFANILGATCLGTATVLHLAGAHMLGWVLVGAVASLAAFAALTGICVGCNLYKLSARVRGIRPGTATRIDLVELGVTTSLPVVIEFSHPLCSECRDVQPKLRDSGRELVVVDVSQSKELARKYNVSVVPTAFLVEANGEVQARLA
jgi:Domain of unknown function (DUF4395)/Thioredoxin